MKKEEFIPARKLVVLAAVLCLGLSGCEAGPNYHAPFFGLPEHFSATVAKGKTSGSVPSSLAVEWWKNLHDPTLNSLIEKAVSGSPSLDIALNRLQALREQEAAVAGQALPDAEAGVGAARGTGSDLARGRAPAPLVAGENTSNFQHVSQISGFDAQWELDIFGKYRREVEAARADTQAMADARNNVLITLISDVVRAYVDMRGLQMQQLVLLRNIQTARAYVHFVRLRYDRGITNGLDITLAERELETLTAQRAPMQATVSSSQYALAVLCGEYPENMMQLLRKPAPIPQTPGHLDTGVPLDLLRTRPDIAIAERELAAATARIGVATADLFPHFSLSAGAGEESLNLGLSSPASFIWSFGPSASVPLLDFGTLDALVNVADYRAKGLLAAYRQRVLEAVRDVDSAASDYAAQQDRLRHLGQALATSKDAVSIATQRFDRGLTDSLNVIDAERQEFDLEQQYVAAQQAGAEQFVALYKSLGAGWQEYQKIPPIRSPQPALMAALVRSSESSK